MWGNSTSAGQEMVMTERERRAEARRKEKREAKEQERLLQKNKESRNRKSYYNPSSFGGYNTTLTCKLCGAEYSRALAHPGTVPCPYCYNEYVQSKEKYLGKVELWGKANRLIHLSNEEKITIDEFREGMKAIHKEYEEFCLARTQLAPTNDRPSRPLLE